MAIESPLFQSAMELLGHSYSHFNRSRELDRKLVILHLANAIELILKDLVLDTGESIYRNPKETITIYGCIESLKDKKIPVPYLNRIELLIDERNAIQHRFGSPNELTTIFYMNIAQSFFKEILRTHYDQDYDEIITQFADENELMTFRLREPSNESELENLKKLARVHPLGALLSAMTYLEKVIMQFAREVGLAEDAERRPPWYTVSTSYLERLGVGMSEELRQKMDQTRRLRNMAAHGRSEPGKEDVSRAIDTIEEYEKFLSSIDRDRVKEKVAEILAERGRRTAELRSARLEGLPPAAFRGIARNVSDDGAPGGPGYGRTE